MYTVFFDRPDGARLSYHVFGDGPISVLLVHGWMASSRVWRTIVPKLRGHGVVAVDLRGAGQSSRGQQPLSLELLADDVLAVSEQVGGARLHLCGHSMGAQIAQLLAVREPGRWRSLTLLSPVPARGLELPTPVAQQFRAAGGVRATFDHILDAACRDLPLPERAGLLVDALSIEPRVIAEGFDAFTRGAPDLPLAHIGAPTLVVGSDDPFLPLDLLEQTVVAPIKNARLVHIPGAGHYPMLERTQHTAAQLLGHWGDA